jgi:two-component system, response regulator RegA
VRDDQRSFGTVLLVDDAVLLINAWTRELSRVGKRVVSAQNRDGVRKVCQEHRPDFAVVDLFLGSETGLDIVRDLKALEPPPYVVVVTGAPTVAYTMEAVRAGADDVFAKPISTRELLESAEGAANERETDPPPTLQQMEWEHISRVLLDCNGNVSQAARRLGIYRQTLQRKLRKITPR